MAVELPDLMSVEKAAAYTGLHQETLRRYLRTGRLRGIKTKKNWLLRVDFLLADLAGLAVKG